MRHLQSQFPTGFPIVGRPSGSQTTLARLLVVGYNKGKREEVGLCEDDKHSTGVYRSHSSSSLGTPKDKSRLLNYTFILETNSDAGCLVRLCGMSAAPLQGLSLRSERALLDPTRQYLRTHLRSIGGAVDNRLDSRGARSGTAGTRYILLSPTNSRCVVPLTPVECRLSI
jgi:PAS domain